MLTAAPRVSPSPKRIQIDRLFARRGTDSIADSILREMKAKPHLYSGTENPKHALDNTTKLLLQACEDTVDNSKKTYQAVLNKIEASLNGRAPTAGVLMLQEALKTKTVNV